MTASDTTTSFTHLRVARQGQGFLIGAKNQQIPPRNFGTKVNQWWPVDARPGECIRRQSGCFAVHGER
jgi:hypothetical protein